LHNKTRVILWLDKFRYHPEKSSTDCKIWESCVICFQTRPKNCEKRLLASSCPSVRRLHGTTRLSHWADFDKTCYFGFIRKIVEKIQVSWKSCNNNGYLTWRRFYIFNNYLVEFFWESEMFKIKFVEKIKTHISCSVTFFPEIVSFVR
jgi:hypothetical protein